MSKPMPTRTHFQFTFESSFKAWTIWKSCSTHMRHPIDRLYPRINGTLDLSGSAVWNRVINSRVPIPLAELFPSCEVWLRFDQSLVPLYRRREFVASSSLSADPNRDSTIGTNSPL